MVEPLLATGTNDQASNQQLLQPALKDYNKMRHYEVASILKHNMLVGIIFFSGLCSVTFGFQLSPTLIQNQRSSSCQSQQLALPRLHPLSSQIMEEPSVDPSYQNKADNKAMAFLRKIGKVGGSTSADFAQAMGVDEGPSGKSAGHRAAMRKCKTSYQICTESGVVDDLSETFPWTSSGTEWIGVTDRVMGGCSSGSITREVVQGIPSNVLRGQVNLVPGTDSGGFVQMATNLGWDPSKSFAIDASDYDGIELDVLYQGSAPQEQYNVHLKTNACLRQFASYRASFRLPSNEWTTVRLPWSDFAGYGPGASDIPLDVTNIRRLGVLAIGREMDVSLAVAGVRFYSVF